MTEHPPSDEHVQKENEAYQTEFDPISDSVSEELVKAVATLNDADPTELSLLSELVDPEALDALFGPKAGDTLRETNGHVLFTYDAYHVRVDSNGQITVHQSDSDGDSKRSLRDENE
ncbi:HalOD1 output domain-containing protein [Haladaptatus sp. DYF46]|uniref:HalOD1 output domain-containing protein n=1 Tax=Haladaptatus sp. DYF46 TaxID=2886041 RepID=UPI001E5D7C49|nr:HalOD1 output domain-containing protein [Haladaptatus sp. DYF46]